MPQTSHNDCHCHPPPHLHYPIKCHPFPSCPSKPSLWLATGVSPQTPPGHHKRVSPDCFTLSLHSPNSSAVRAVQGECETVSVSVWFQDGAVCHGSATTHAGGHQVSAQGLITVLDLHQQLVILTLIPAWINNWRSSKVSNEINYPFPNFYKKFHHKISRIITYPCSD